MSTIRLTPTATSRWPAPTWPGCSEELAKVNRPEPHWLLAAYDWGIANVLKLLKTGGGWEDVPDAHRDYATDIILAAEANALAEQIMPGSEPVYG